MNQCGRAMRRADAATHRSPAIAEGCSCRPCGSCCPRWVTSRWTRQAEAACARCSGASATATAAWRWSTPALVRLAARGLSRASLLARGFPAPYLFVDPLPGVLRCVPRLLPFEARISPRLAPAARQLRLDLLVILGRRGLGPGSARRVRRTAASSRPAAAGSRTGRSAASHARRGRHRAARGPAARRRRSPGARRTRTARRQPVPPRPGARAGRGASGTRFGA